MNMESTVRARPAVKPAAPKLDELLNDEQPLDEQEQQAVIAALEEQQLQQARIFRRVYAVVANVIAVFFLYAAYQQLAHPWEARYTGELRPVTSADSVATVLALQGVALAAAGCALLVKLPRRGDRNTACLPATMQSRVWLGISIVGAGVGCFYWSNAMRSSIAKYGYEVGAKWELLWLPLGPLGYCLLCWHVLASLATTGQQVRQLKKLAYDFKKV